MLFIYYAWVLVRVVVDARGRDCSVHVVAGHALLPARAD